MLLFDQATIHTGFVESNYLEIPYWESPNFSDDEINRMISIISVSSLETKPMLEYKICIPKEYAREESDEFLGSKKSCDVPHYEIYIERQIGTVRNRRDTYLYLRLPKSKMLVTIILYMDGGVGFDPKFHKYILREMDALDRRVVLGFCLKNESLLKLACYSSESAYKPALDLKAASYRASQMPKRLKTGSRGIDMTFAYSDLEPYEESSIFKDLQFI